ncbi:MAG: diaminopimelate epimerase [Actinomycetota bacterium]|jgi:diaminopimelate epimerase|nr:diaminopimelate epimerase [Actinomycetota bacterium]
MPHLVLTKHHGLGNDFLVLLDTDDAHAADQEAMAVALCDRHTGIGADGLIRLGPGLRMHLHNADGSRAEMSGNGVRCLAQAIIDNGVHGGPDFEIQTDAGPRWVATNFNGKYTVDMGPARIVASDPTARRAEVDTGNPHLVLADEGQDLLELGRQHPDVNVELVSGEGFELTMRVHERGAGITRACGTGSCAAAAAAHDWGLVGTNVTVHNPGGDLEVELKDETVLLTGPAVFIARIEVPWP